MATNQYYTNCPVCWKDTLSVNESNILFPNLDSQCENCGFYTTTNVWMASLEEVLEERFNNWYEDQEEDLTYEEYRAIFDKKLAPEIKKEYDEYKKTYKKIFV